MSTALAFPNLWMSTVCSGSVRSVLSLYNRDAVLVPTYDTSILRGPVQLRAYFRRFMGKDRLCGRVNGSVEQRIGAFRVISGVYTFRWMEHGKPDSAVARFTFVLSPAPGDQAGWRVVAHHSSEMPSD